MQQNTARPKPIIIVQGAQWGSEAKGAVAAALAKFKKVDYAVRTGAVNAGHTVYYGTHPQPFKMQQLPTAWASNPKVRLVLGAGTYLHPEILAAEIELVSKITGSDIRGRLLIDHRASLHLPEHTVQAQLENRHHAIGATGKGCSVAITDKIRYRGKGYRLFKDWWSTNQQAAVLGLHDLQFTDTVEILHNAYHLGQQILLEGTQGSLLDLNLGPYPYTTHKPTQSIEWALEAGLPLGYDYEVVMVARTYPIRVAGNSGPMPKETTWPNLARTINRKLMLRRMGQRVKSFALDEYEKVMYDMANNDPRWAGKFPLYLDGSINFEMHKWTAENRVQFQVTLSEFPQAVLHQMSLPTVEELANLFEFTTVTKKLRRIADWHGPSVAWSCKVNNGAYIALTFWNYWFPDTWNQTAITWNTEMERMCYQVEADANIPVRYITTGPETEHMIRVEKLRADWRDEQARLGNTVPIKISRASA